MTTSSVQLTTDGTGKYVATATFSEDAVTKHVQRFVQCNTAGAESATSANPYYVYAMGSGVYGTTSSILGTLPTTTTANIIGVISATASILGTPIVLVNNSGNFYTSTTASITGVLQTTASILGTPIVLVNNSGSFYAFTTASILGVLTTVTTASILGTIPTTTTASILGTLPTTTTANIIGVVAVTASILGIQQNTASITGNVNVLLTPQATLWSYNTGITATATTAPLISAAGVGSSLYITDVIVVMAAAGSAVINEGVGVSAKLGPYSFAANGGLVSNFKIPVKLSANSALNVSMGAAGNITVNGYTLP